MLERQDMNEPAVAGLTVATLLAVVVRVGLTFAQNHHLVRELETDPLTGLSNRGKLVYDLDRLFSLGRPAPSRPRVPRSRRIQGLQRRLRPSGG